MVVHSIARRNASKVTEGGSIYWWTDRCPRRPGRRGAKSKPEDPFLETRMGKRTIRRDGLDSVDLPAFPPNLPRLDPRSSACPQDSALRDPQVEFFPDLPANAKGGLLELEKRGLCPKTKNDRLSDHVHLNPGLHPSPGFPGAWVVFLWLPWNDRGWLLENEARVAASGPRNRSHGVSLLISERARLLGGGHRAHRASTSP